MPENERLTYFIVTRKLFDSPIWRGDPHLLKLFLYLVGMARYKKKPKRFGGFEVKRGELVTSLQDIADANQYVERRAKRTWTRMRVSRMLDRLENMQQIELLRDTYGTHIKIVNYDKYQSPITYKKTNSVTDSVTSSVTIPLQQRYDSVTTALLYNKDNKVNKGVIKKKATTPSISQKLKTNIAILEMEAVFEDVKSFVFFQKENNKDEKIICHALSQLIKKCSNGNGTFERWPKKRAWGYCEKIINAETQIENARESEAENDKDKFESWGG